MKTRTAHQEQRVLQRLFRLYDRAVTQHQYLRADRIHALVQRVVEMPSPAREPASLAIYGQFSTEPTIGTSVSSGASVLSEDSAELTRWAHWPPAGRLGA